MPKIAALLAAAHLPDPEPVPTVTYRSAGRLLIIGALEAAERAAALLADVLDVTLFAQGGAGAQERRYPVLGGRIDSLKGWLGAFELKWTRDNPIDLDLCTRCNACVAACPEGAIGLDYQVDLAQVRVAPRLRQGVRGGRRHRLQPRRPGLQRTVRPGAGPARRARLPAACAAAGLLPRRMARMCSVLLKLRELVGEFEKPKFFAYKQKLCAHSRNETVGCNACVDICSAEAITSDKSRQQIKVNPNLCVGCGACTTVCPTGALTYAYPRASEQGSKFRTLLSTYARPAASSRRCCCTARSAAAHWWKSSAAPRSWASRRACRPTCIPVAAVAHGQPGPGPLARRHRARARRRWWCSPPTRRRRSTATPCASRWTWRRPS